MKTSGKKHKLGIVFSGGGVKGLAHIGTIKVMEELGLSPTYVAGTSAGALVGALYAQGYTADEILEFFMETPVFSWRNYGYKKPGLIDLEKMIPHFEQYFPTDNFADLKRKLNVVATNLETSQSVVFSEGQIIRPTLASAALPVVFTPIKINGAYYADGGITNNFPVDLLQPHCENIIGVYVNPIRDVEPSAFKNSLSVLQRAFQISTSYHSFPKFEDCSVLIMPEELIEYNVMDLRKLKTIYEIGYNTALTHIKELENIKGLLV